MRNFRSSVDSHSRRVPKGRPLTNSSRIRLERIKPDRISKGELTAKVNPTQSGFPEPMCRNLLILKIKEFSLSVIRTKIEFYKIIRVLGEGSYGTVHLATPVLCNKLVAIKCFDKLKIMDISGTEKVIQEIHIMKSVNHPGVVKLFEVFEDERNYYLVMECAQGGDLMREVRRRKRFAEEDFKPLLRQIVRSLHHLHSNCILHRDVKLDNVLLAENNQIKLCDFGISIKMKKRKRITEHIGTPAYMAPEIVMGDEFIDFQSDVWSLGILSFIALTGRGPFKGKNIDDLQQNILNSQPNFPKEVHLSSEMRSLIDGMLCKDPESRLTLREVADRLGVELGDTDSFIQEKTINMQHLETLSNLGFNQNQIMFDLKKNAMNHATALYKLM